MRFLVLFLTLPAFALAAPVPAGFPTSSLWLSKTELTDGESVSIYTVVYNSSDEPLTGSVEFMVDSEVVGAKSITAAPGTTQVISQAWTADEGTHAFSARLTGSTEELSQTVTGTTTVAVAPKPPPPEAVQKTVEAASAVEAAIASTTPIVQNIASTTFATTESIRESAVKALEKLASSTTPTGEVLGIEDEQTALSPEENAAQSFDIGGWIQNVWQAIIAALLFLARSPLWFYVAIGTVLFFVILFVKTALSDRGRYR
ncbi:MAG TPA: hypothetical protein VEA92_01250 [Candidatus Paceibacterota bacterium]|nr:hypothetical protein [Candidatus Paceibacterota bacterium]